MHFDYLFKEIIKNEEHYFKLNVVKQTSKYKYILELYKKRTDTVFKILLGKPARKITFPFITKLNISDTEKRLNRLR